MKSEFEPINCPGCMHRFDPGLFRAGPRAIFLTNKGTRCAFHTRCPACSYRFGVVARMHVNRFEARRVH